MDVEYSDHAQERVGYRKIPKNLIKQCLVKPDEIRESFGRRKLYRLKVGDKILEVVSKKEKGKLVVITAYFIKEEKYESKV